MSSTRWRDDECEHQSAEGDSGENVSLQGGGIAEILKGCIGCRRGWEQEERRKTESRETIVEAGQEAQTNCANELGDRDY